LQAELKAKDKLIAELQSAQSHVADSQVHAAYSEMLANAQGTSQGLLRLRLKTEAETDTETGIRLRVTPKLRPIARPGLRFRPRLTPRLSRLCICVFGTLVMPLLSSYSGRRVRQNRKGPASQGSGQAKGNRSGGHFGNGDCTDLLAFDPVSGVRSERVVPPAQCHQPEGGVTGGSGLREGREMPWPLPVDA
jgi:hypothetical protein